MQTERQSGLATDEGVGFWVSQTGKGRERCREEVLSSQDGQCEILWNTTEWEQTTAEQKRLLSVARNVRLV